MRKRNKEVMPDGAEIIETDELLKIDNQLNMRWASWGRVAHGTTLF